MSLYHCSCGLKTSVIDTRTSYRRLRRRRQCACGNRFSTLEVPLEARSQLSQLVVWAVERTPIDGDLTSAVNSRIDEILLGKHPPDE